MKKKDWCVPVPVGETTEDKTYFIGRKYGNTYMFWSCGLNSKESFTTKPGIAIRFVGGHKLERVFYANPHVQLVAIEVPHDADKRWKARKKQPRR